MILSPLYLKFRPCPNLVERKMTMQSRNTTATNQQMGIVSMYFNSLEIVSQCRTQISQSKLDCCFINREVVQSRLVAQMEDGWWYREIVVRMLCMRILSIQKILCKFEIIPWEMGGASKIGDRMNRCKQAWSLIYCKRFNLFIIWFFFVRTLLTILILTSLPKVDTSFADGCGQVKLVNFICVVKCPVDLIIVPLIVARSSWIFDKCSMGMFCDICWPLVWSPSVPYTGYDTQKHLTLWNVPIFNWLVFFAYLSIGVQNSMFMWMEFWKAIGNMATDNVVDLRSMCKVTQIHHWVAMRKSLVTTPSITQTI